MLHWPAGLKKKMVAGQNIAGYDNVHKSTGFEGSQPAAVHLPEYLETTLQRKAKILRIKLFEQSIKA